MYLRESVVWEPVFFLLLTLVVASVMNSMSKLPHPFLSPALLPEEIVDWKSVSPYHLGGLCISAGNHLPGSTAHLSVGPTGEGDER